MKEAILIVSFGTTHPDTLQKNIAAVEDAIQAAFPEIPCFRAFTSSFIRRRLKEKMGMEIDSVKTALEKLTAKGFTRVILQPTLLLPGAEYDGICRDVLDIGSRLEIRMGLPLLWDDGDLAGIAEILKKAYPLPEDTTLLAMGHGTAHAADGIYSRLAEHMAHLGMALCTVEGAIDFETVIARLTAGTNRKVHLIPLLLVAGDHSRNDMAGENPGSLRGMLTEAGFEVSWSLRGLGEIPAIREAYVQRVLTLLK